MTLLPLLSDLLLLIATLGLACVSLVLSRRGPPPPTVDTTLPHRLDELVKRLEALECDVSARPISKADPTLERRLASATSAAEDRIGRLELLLAGLEDFEPPTGDSEPLHDADLPPMFRAARDVRAKEVWT